MVERVPAVRKAWSGREQAERMHSKKNDEKAISRGVGILFISIPGKADAMVKLFQIV